MTPNKPDLDRIEGLAGRLDSHMGKQEGAGWQDISTAPKEGPILVWWPIVAVDDEGNLTTTEVGGDCLVTEWDNGSWAEPSVLAGLNSNYFDDDREYAEYPTHWRPLPTPPALSRTQK